MTTREYQEAYDDDSDRVRSWPAQDAQEPPDDYCGSARCSNKVEEFSNEDTRLRAEIVRLRTLCGKAADHLERVVAERDAALEYIAGLAATLSVPA